MEFFYELKQLPKKKKLTKEQYIVVQTVVTPVFMEEMLVLVHESCGQFGYEKFFFSVLKNGFTGLK